jgi:tryptophan-rich sensory protein
MVAVFILVSLLAGGLGAFFTASSVKTWYATLNRPSFSPPDWLFGPVWTTLYIMMGIAAGLLWQQGIASPAVKAAIIAFAVQLALNAIWSPLFFGQHSPLFGLIDIILLWLAIVVTIILFWQVHRTAALLLVPYFLWVSFATILNLRLWQLNR